MMNRLKSTFKLLGLACAASLCLGATYTWSGNGVGDAWDTEQNWGALGGIGYPDDESDDAIFPYDAGGWTCELITESIEDLSIGASVAFSPADPNDPNGTTLTVDSLSIGSPTSTSVYEVEVTGNATIQVLKNP